MASISTGWSCVCTATIASSTATTATITVTAYWQNNSWDYDINRVSAWVYCGSSSYQVMSSGSVDSTGVGTSGKVSLGSYTFTVNKTTAAQSISCYAKITSNSSYVSGTKTSSTISVSVPAKTSYKITYNANGGSSTPSAQTKWHGTNIKLAAAISRTGYAFGGWNTNASGTGTNYAAGATYSANAAATLYAKWTVNKYTITFNANGGSGGPTTQTKNYGTALTLSTSKPTRTNYTFLGWSESSTAKTATYSAGGSFTKNANTTLYAVWQLSYTKPRITNFTVARCDSSGTASDTGTYALVKFNWACDKTISSITIKWKQSTASSYASSTTVSASGTSGSVEKVVGAGTLSAEYTYNIQVVVADASGSNSNVKNINPMVIPFDVLKGGKGVAIGKPANISNKLDVAWSTNIDGNINLSGGIYLDTNNKSISGKTTDGTNVALIGCSGTNNTLVGYGGYDLKLGQTGVYGYDIYHHVSNTASGSDYYRPYFRAGDSLTIYMFLGGWVTSSGTQVCFTVPLAKPIIGSPTVTVASKDGLIIRQNGSYTHGSASSTYVKPSSYSCTLYGNYGLVVTATLSTTTNAVNNSPAGIQWSGTITFS